ncbi:hypothetical protein HF521_021248 [Silurus meridionalis]|uniref:Apoptosis regulatory protein Siva n=2 Tax=Silurus meridionalis TaxID=175797 RepID=A0A8T0BF92_SILME|nr:hypothetical protein HF521_021248 [Silurus meridionalis]
MVNELQVVVLKRAPPRNSAKPLDGATDYFYTKALAANSIKAQRDIAGKQLGRGAGLFVFFPRGSRHFFNFKMPKRSCPFTDSFSTQYKIHVGQKELNLHGVFGNKYRQEVYEKTKNLLFNGTRAVMGQIWKVNAEGKCSAVDMCNRVDVTPANNQLLLKGQTLIGLDGKLTKAKAASGGASVPAVCAVCQRSSGTRTTCSQCDRSACPSCTQQCSSCSNRCCSVCTITDYTERYDKVLCCSCSS